MKERENKEFAEFTGKFMRLDGKAVKDDVVKKKEEYDPRKHRLPHGVRRDLVLETFSGKGVRIV